MSNVDIYKEVWLRDIILGLVDKGFLFFFFFLLGRFGGL